MLFLNLLLLVKTIVLANDAQRIVKNIALVVRGVCFEGKSLFIASNINVVNLWKCIKTRR